MNGEEFSGLAKKAGFNDSIVEALKKIEDPSHLKNEDLDAVGISREDEVRKHIWIWLHSIMVPVTRGEIKVFNDPIHGHIEFHPLLVKIIDTPQFQRLRNIKQLGGGYYVFPCASHNRFEHSLGVCHLAGEFVKILQRNQPELGITPCDMLCVQIAGLCHDLGHGPFSHLFDGIFLPNYPDTKWKHEDASEKMLDHLIGVNNLKSSFDNCGLNDDDIMFIKELISGKYNEKRQHKKFLYEIIANKTNEIDVDKWDYFARDCHFLGIPNSFDHLRYMKFAQVIKVPEDGLQICCRDKEVLNLYEMFHTRMMLHKRAYKHKTTIAVEHMISDALILANDKFHLIGESGNSIKMSKVITDMVAYSKLSDAVIDIIIQDPSDKFRQAQQLFDRLARRQLYKYIGSIKFKLFDQTEAIKEILEFKKNFRGDAESKAILESDIFFKEVSFDYGMKGENPVDKMYFYKKSTPDEAECINKHDVSSLLLPSSFMEKYLYLYCKKYDEKCCEIVYNCFNQWCKDRHYTLQTPFGNKSDTKRKRKREEDTARNMPKRIMKSNEV